MMIFVDGHVHIYDCFDVGLLLDSAWNNFQKTAKLYAGKGQPVSYVLLLTEGKSEKWFQDFCAGVDLNNQHENKIADGWCGIYSKESGSVLVFKQEKPSEKMYLVQGCQIVSREKIEVLGLFCNADIEDDLSLPDTIEEVKKKSGIPVLPWGVGKWFGSRGEILEKYLQVHEEDILYVGDNGGRPRFWPTPTLFKTAGDAGVPVLPGTDPLPISGEASRVGSFGFYIKEDVPDSESPVIFLKDSLASRKAVIYQYGPLQNNIQFLLNQIRLRFS